MSTRTRAGPASSLPPLHTLQLGCPIELHHTVDLAIWMLVVLSRVLLLTLHVDRSNTKELGLRTGERDLGAPVLRPILRFCQNLGQYRFGALPDTVSQTCLNSPMADRLELVRDLPSQWLHTSLRCCGRLGECTCRSPRSRRYRDHSCCSDGLQGRALECYRGLSVTAGERHVRAYRFCTSAKKSLHRSTRAFAVGYLSRSTSCWLFGS